MIGMGIGIGLGARQARAPQHPSDTDICAVIAAKNVVKFAYEGIEYTAEPYAVFHPSEGGEKMLNAVVLRTSDHTHNAWEPQNFRLSKITGFGTLDATFIPSLSFNPADFGTGLICSIDLG